MLFCRFIHEEMVRMGTNLRSDLDVIHQREIQQFDKSLDEVMKKMSEAHQEVSNTNSHSSHPMCASLTNTAYFLN